MTPIDALRRGSEYIFRVKGSCEDLVLVGVFEEMVLRDRRLGLRIRVLEMNGGRMDCHEASGTLWYVAELRSIEPCEEEVA